MKRRIHIAIDGPVAAGKGAVAAGVARRLQILNVETGAMYRAVALIGIRAGIELTKEQDLLDALSQHTLTIQPDTQHPDTCMVAIDGVRVTEELRSPEVSKGASRVAQYSRVRSYLIQKQQEIAANYSVVMEGRDIASVVLPDASVKVYLTASLEIRAKRRYDQQKTAGMEQSLAQVTKETEARDSADMNRTESPLKPAPGSVTIDTSELTIDEVVDRIVALVPQNA